jgi:hypothetical protein
MLIALLVKTLLDVLLALYLQIEINLIYVFATKDIIMMDLFNAKVKK